MHLILASYRLFDIISTNAFLDNVAVSGGQLTHTSAANSATQDQAQSIIIAASNGRSSCSVQRSSKRILLDRPDNFALMRMPCNHRGMDGPFLDIVRRLRTRIGNLLTASIEIKSEETK